MATNLRLPAELQASLRSEAERTGRSQQQLIREAVDRYLAELASRRLTGADAVDRLVRLGLIRPPRNSGRHPTPRLQLPPEVNSLVLLGRAERV